MWRAGQAYGVEVSPPENVWRNFGRTLFDVTVARTGWRDLLSFWSAKSRIYSEFINHTVAIKRESQWARAIEVAFQGARLGATFELVEKDVIDKVKQLSYLKSVAFDTSLQ